MPIYTFHIWGTAYPYIYVLATIGGHDEYEIWQVLLQAIFTLFFNLGYQFDSSFITQ